MVSDDLCDPQLQPPMNRSCATDPCPPEYVFYQGNCGTLGISEDYLQLFMFINRKTWVLRDSFANLANRGLLT